MSSNSENSSQLKSRAQICEARDESRRSALILEFSGNYGCESEGNNDAHYMESIKAACLKRCTPEAIVFDLRQFGYEWGDALLCVFRWNSPAGLPDVQVDDRRGPPVVALVVSDLCRPGLSTWPARLLPPMFDEMVTALEFVGIRAPQFRDELQ